MAPPTYAAWRDDPHLPLECLLNALLLYGGDRDAIQFDVASYSDPRTVRRIHEFAAACEGAAVAVDAHGNLALSLAGAGERAARPLADRLDPCFYSARADLATVLDAPRAVQVSLAVAAGGTRTGALLVQMCEPGLAPAALAVLHARFLALARRIEAIDPALQTSLTFHTKAGPWRRSPELVVAAHRSLPPLSVQEGGGSAAA